MPYPSFLPDIQRWSCETRRLRWLVLGSCLLSMTGCGGCRRTTFSEDGASKDEIAKKSQPLPRLDVTSLQALPASGSDGLAMKPGHWYELQQSARANETDEALMVSCSAIGRAIPYRSLPMLDPGTTLSFERDIRLARGQRKLLAMEFFYPGMHAALGEAEAFGNASIRVAYRPRFIGAAVREESYPVAAMPDYQFNLVVLSQNPDRYRFLGGLSCVNWPSQVNIDDERIRPFRVVQVAQAEAQSSLPHRMMAWTSTSHLLWNDCAASTLLASQQQSLVDWLHLADS